MWIVARGYSITEMGERQARKNGLLEQMTAAAGAEGLRETVLEAIANKAPVLQVKRRGRLMGVLVFSRCEADAEEIIARWPDVRGSILPQTGEAGVQAEKVPVLRLVRRVVLPEHDAAIRELENHRDTLAEAENLLADGKARAVLWGDHCILRQHEAGGSMDPAGCLLGIAVGLLFGIAMQNIAIGLCFGVSFALCFGAALSHRKE